MENKVPDLVGLTPGEARRTALEAGFKVLDDGAGEKVTAQMPSPGAKLIAGGQLMLYTYEGDLPRPEELVCVPDVKGDSLAQAATLLRQRGLEMQIDGSGFAVRQEPAAGEYAARGTIVKVSFEMPNP